jgi:hypothetical protein
VGQLGTSKSSSRYIRGVPRTMGDGYKFWFVSQVLKTKGATTNHTYETT